MHQPTQDLDVIDVGLVSEINQRNEPAIRVTHSKQHHACYPFLTENFVQETLKTRFI